MPPATRNAVRMLAAFFVYAVVAAVVSAPVAAERAVETARFEDRLGALPVEVALSHNGVSTLDTVVLGRLFWDRTGVAGFGAYIRATGPPEAGGTLASYVSPKFVRANALFVDDPGVVARTYGEELRSRLWRRFLWLDLAAGLVGGLVLVLVFRGRAPLPTGVRPRWGVVMVAVSLSVCLGASTAGAFLLFDRWDGNKEIDASYPMPGIEALSFSSPQTLEVARQIQPFIEKNTKRIRKRTQRYETAALASLRAELPRHSAGLTAGEGERIVLAEADPQGSQVGTRVRASMYPLLVQLLGEDVVAMRTISGDVTSNGTLAEDGFVGSEATASNDIPVVVAKGDHDTAATVDQFHTHDMTNPDFDTTDVGGLRVVAGNDPAFKALFGGLVTNTTGVTETEMGADLRAEVDPDLPLVVLLHQPRAAAGYLGVDDVSGLVDALGRETAPWDDGIADLPPGSINIGHLHDASPPRVIWNTDGDMVTWTVVNQLGTSGGVEENPTINRFSTPFSTPLKTVSIQLQYVNTDTGLQSGYASIDIATDGTVTITDRVDLGLPGGLPVSRDDVTLGPDGDNGAGR